MLWDFLKQDSLEFNMRTLCYSLDCFIKSFEVHNWNLSRSLVEEENEAAHKT